MNDNTLSTDKIASDLHALVEDVESLLKGTAGQADSKLDEIRNRLAGTVANARVTCRDLKSKASSQVRQGIETTDATVRAHPWESVGVAFAVGLVVGVLIGRR